MKYCYGVDIGGTTVKMGLFEENGNILDKWEIVTRVEDEGKEILPDIAASILEKTKEHGLEKTDIIGIGVGVPAPVTADGIVNGSANLGWTYKEVKRELEELTGITSVIGNDANVAALGEMWKGGGVSKAGEILIPFIEKPYREKAFFANREIEFKLATLGNDAGICGSAKMMLDA